MMKLLPLPSSMIFNSARTLAMVLAMAVLAACESVPLTTPYPAYDAAARPVSDTAIFRAWDGQQGAELRVEEVDGKSHGCVSHNSFGNHTCPFWVRVAPGTHTFTIHAYYDLRGNTYYRTRDVQVTVPNMQATHTYLLDFNPASDRPPVVRDLGAHSKRPWKLCPPTKVCPELVPSFD